MITGNEDLDWSLEFASSLLRQVNIECGLTKHFLWPRHFLLCRERDHKYKYSCKAISVVRGFLLLLLSLDLVAGWGDLFLPVLLFVSVTLQAL